MKSDKIFTFEIGFRNPKTNKDDQTQFCAKSSLDAIRLFNDWCVTDERMAKPAEINSIDVVFNQDDADEYGSDYGKPDDYKDSP